jgi:hypothetical protein
VNPDPGGDSRPNATRLRTASLRLVTDIITVATRAKLTMALSIRPQVIICQSVTSQSTNACTDECNFSYLDSTVLAFPFCQVNAQPSEFQTDNEDQALPVRQGSHN